MLLSQIQNGRKVYLNQDGDPLVGGQVFFYIPGTTTPSITYVDDAGLSANTSPIILDASGSCVAFGSQQSYREFVLDALGNQISDSIVVVQSAAPAPTLLSLGVSTAMLPVVQSLSIAAAEALLTAGQTAPFHLSLSPADQTINVAPIGNPPNTLTSLNVVGTTISGPVREFLVNIGLTSNLGQGGAAGNDKVGLYCGVVANAGSADVWCFNTVMNMTAGSGNYTAQGYELDFNNLNVNRGVGLLSGGFAGPQAYGLSISGASTFRSTAALLISGSAVQWSAGIIMANNCTIEHGILDLNNSGTSYTIAGTHSNGISTTAAVFTGGAAMIMGNSHTISWQSADKLSVISDYTDAGNNRIIGLGANLVQSPVPVTAPSLSLPALGQLQWPGTAAGVRIIDYVDTAGNRNVGFGASAVFMGALTAPFANGTQLGTSNNAWGDIWSISGIQTPSDRRLKTDIRPLLSIDALDAINWIKPISFKWKRDLVPGSDDKVHFGFDADDLRGMFGDETAVFRYEAGDEYKTIKKDELIAVMWQAIRELSTKVAVHDKT